MEEYRTSIRSLWRYILFLKNKKTHVALAIATGIIYGISSGLGIPVILKYTASYLFEQETIQPFLLTILVLLPGLITIIRGISGFLSSYYFAECGQYIVERLRLMIFEKIQRLHLGFFKDYPPAEVIARSINASTIIQTHLVEIANAIVMQPMVLLGATSYLAYVCIQQRDLLVLLLFLSILPLFIYPIRRIGRLLRRKSNLMQGRTAEIVDKLNHNLEAIKEVRAFCLEEREQKHYAEACKDFSDAFLKVVKYQLMVSPMIEIVAAFGIGFAMFYAYRCGLQLEIFMSLAAALYFGYDSFKKIGDVSNKIQASMGAVDRIESILHEPEKVTDVPGAVAIEDCRGEVFFDHVTFAYDTGDNVLKDIAIRLSPGKKYALVGASGAGKSTFVNLILRFYDPTQGAVKLDRIDLRDLQQKSLRQQIGYVPQDPVLINDTVLNNILWGNPEATREEVIEAAKQAYADTFIQQLPKGYDTVVGESGSAMSGGQRQRIALARVFLKRSPILIFDEATSALDAESQEAIYRAIESVAEKRTIIMISHRLTQMATMDEILVFEEGRIIEKGRHEELLQKETIYRKLYEKQQQQDRSEEVKI